MQTEPHTYSTHKVTGLLPAGVRESWILRAAQMIQGQGGGARLDARGVFQPRGHMDAAESAFINQALTHIVEELFPTLVPPLKARKFIPTTIEGDPGDQSYRWLRPTRTGIARFANAPMADLPVVGAYIDEINVPYYTVGAKIQYDYFELLAIGAAKKNGQTFDGIKEKLIAALEANEKKLDLIAAFGSATPPNSYGVEVDADVGMTGLLNCANMSSYTIPAGASGSKAWANKTADEVLADLYGIVAAMEATTYEVHVPNMMLMPIAQYQAIASRKVSETGNAETILSYFMRTRREIGRPIQVNPWMYMQGAGAAGADRLLIYSNDTRMARHPLSVDKSTLPASQQGLVTEQVVYSKTPGFVAFRPLSIMYGDGI